MSKIESYFASYKMKHGPYTYDHDTFQLLPDEITGINSSYHLKQAYVDMGRDTYGYWSFIYNNESGTEINALQHFYLSIYQTVESYLEESNQLKYHTKRNDYFPMEFSKYFAFGLFDT